MVDRKVNIRLACSVPGPTFGWWCAATPGSVRRESLQACPVCGRPRPTSWGGLRPVYQGDCNSVSDFSELVTAVCAEV